jgi:hypothetical protein
MIGLHVEVYPSCVRNIFLVRIVKGVQSFQLDYSGKFANCAWYAKYLARVIGFEPSAGDQSLKVYRIRKGKKIQI